MNSAFIENEATDFTYFSKPQQASNNDHYSDPLTKVWQSAHGDFSWRFEPQWMCAACGLDFGLPWANQVKSGTDKADNCDCFIGFDEENRG